MISLLFFHSFPFFCSCVVKQKGNNDEIPSPSLKDGAALAKWKLDRQNRPISGSKLGADGDKDDGDYDDDEEEGMSYRDDGNKDDDDCEDSDDDDEDDEDEDEEDLLTDIDYEIAAEKEKEKDKEKEIAKDKEDGLSQGLGEVSTSKIITSEQSVSEDDLYSTYDKNEGREKEKEKEKEKENQKEIVKGKGKENEKGEGESKTEKGFQAETTATTPAAAVAAATTPAAAISTTKSDRVEKVLSSPAPMQILPLGYHIQKAENARLKLEEEKIKVEKMKLGKSASEERKAYEEKKEKEMKIDIEMKKEKEENRIREEKEEILEREERNKKEVIKLNEMKKKTDGVALSKTRGIEEKIEREEMKGCDEKKEKQKDQIIMKATGMKTENIKDSNKNVPSVEVQKLFPGNIPEGKYGSFPEDSFLDTSDIAPDGEGVRGSAGNEIENAMLIVVDDEEPSPKGNASRRTTSALNFFGGRDRAKSGLSDKDREVEDQMFEFERLGSLKKVDTDSINDTDSITNDMKTLGVKKKSFIGSFLKIINPIRKKKQKSETN